MASAPGADEGRAGERTHLLDESSAQEPSRTEAQGAGGGGGVRMTPVGALEIGPHGARFVHFHRLPPLLGAAALGLLLGWVLANRGR